MPSWPRSGGSRGPEDDSRLSGSGDFKEASSSGLSEQGGIEASPNLVAFSPAWSPSPSPALSAYTSSSTDSSDYDSELASLSLDDWPTHTQGPRDANAGGSTSSRYAFPGRSLPPHASRDGMSGAATPVPGSESRTPWSRSTDASDRSAASQPDDDGLDEAIVDELEGEGQGFDVQDEDEEDMHASGVPAARGWKLTAREFDTPAFRKKVLDMFSKELKLGGWAESDVHPALLPLRRESLGLKRVSGAFSNVVIFASYKVSDEDRRRAGADSEALIGPPTVLLRIYGTATEVLLSRRAELLILHTLSSLYEIGPHILGTFANGRVEEFFDCVPIGKSGMRDLGDRTETIGEDGSLLLRGKEGPSQWAARRMRELHEVPLDPIRTVLEQGDLHVPSEKGFGRGIERGLFARSHRPRRPSAIPHQQSARSAANVSANLGQGSGSFQPSAASSQQRLMRDSPAPMTPKDEVPPAQASSITDAAATGARAQALEMRGRLPQHRNNSVTSFDSLATSFSSTASTSSLDNYPLKSPALRADSYTDSVNAARRGSAMSGEAYSHQSSGHRAHSRQRTGSHSRDPYPGVWRRTKRWSREAAKVLAIVDEFARSPEGRAACAAALRNCPYQLSASLPGAACENGGELAPMDGSKPVPTSLNIGPVSSLRTLLLAISAIDLQRLVLEMDAFKRYTRAWERREGHSRRVLTHGDTQYGNLLIRKEMNPNRPVASGMPRIRAAEDAASPLGGAAQPRSRSRSRKNLVPHERLVVIDMEYLNHGPRAYDIANMFVEMGADYDHPTDSWNMTANGPYPSTEMRRRWLRAYAEQGRLMRMRGKTPKLPSATTSTADVPALAPLPPSAISSSAGESTSRLGSGDSLTDGQATPGTQQQIKALEKSNGQTQASRSSIDTVNSDHDQPASALSPISAFGSLKDAGPLEAVKSPAMNARSPQIHAQSALVRLDASLEREVDRLEREVKVWLPACHAVWALWGITFSRERVEGLLQTVKERVREHWDDGTEIGHRSTDACIVGAVAHTPLVGPGCSESFDNLRYALGRVEMFRKTISNLGIVVA